MWSFIFIYWSMEFGCCRPGLHILSISSPRDGSVAWMEKLMCVQDHKSIAVWRYTPHRLAHDGLAEREVLAKCGSRRRPPWWSRWRVVGGQQAGHHMVEKMEENYNRLRLQPWWPMPLDPGLSLSSGCLWTNYPILKLQFASIHREGT